MRSVLFVLVIALASCNDSDKIKSAAPGQMLIVIDGVEKTSTTASARIRGATTASNPSATVEAKFDLTSEKFTIVLSASTQEVLKPVSAGEFVVEGVDIQNNYGIVYYSPNHIVSESYVSFNVGGESVGKITITEVDTANKLISGTFEAKVSKDKGADPMTISQGSFTKIPYQD